MGMTPAAAHAFHELKLMDGSEQLSEGFANVKVLANSQHNPRMRQIYNLFNEWR